MFEAIRGYHLSADQIEKEARRLLHVAPMFQDGIVAPDETNIERIRDGVRMVAEELGNFQHLMGAVLETLYKEGVYKK